MDTETPTPALEPVLRAMTRISMRSYRTLIWGMAVCMLQDTILLAIFLFATMQQARILQNVPFLTIMTVAMIFNLLAVGTFVWAWIRALDAER